MSNDKVEERTVVVRYTVKPERLEQHEALVRGVFEALSQARPPGLRYEVVKLHDGLSFMHRASIAAGVPHPLLGLPAFQRFIEGIGDRCSTPPATEAVVELGRY
jgi:hypothetical protein